MTKIPVTSQGSVVIIFYPECLISCMGIPFHSKYPILLTGFWWCIIPNFLMELFLWFCENNWSTYFVFEIPMPIQNISKSHFNNFRLLIMNPFNAHEISVQFPYCSLWQSIMFRHGAWKSSTMWLEQCHQPAHLGMVKPINQVKPI